MSPLAIDLYSGLGGWAEGLLAEGYEVVGFDIEQHVYGEHRYPAQLVLQDVRTLHGSQFAGAALIVASPPCQEYSYMAMPWSRAKQKVAAIKADETGEARRKLMELFDTCFRIQREACQAAGRHIPLVVENVKGAQPWVGRARWNFGSYYLWGDVPALMPITRAAMKNAGGSWFRVSHNKGSHHLGDAIPHTPHMTNPDEHRGIKHAGASGRAWFDCGPAAFGSKEQQAPHGLRPHRQDSPRALAPHRPRLSAGSGGRMTRAFHTALAAVRAAERHLKAHQESGSRAVAAGTLPLWRYQTRLAYAQSRRNAAQEVSFAAYVAQLRSPT